MLCSGIHNSGSRTFATSSGFSGSCFDCSWRFGREEPTEPIASAASIAHPLLSDVALCFLCYRSPTTSCLALRRRADIIPLLRFFRLSSRSPRRSLSSPHQTRHVFGLFWWLFHNNCSLPPERRTQSFASSSQYTNSTASSNPSTASCHDWRNGPLHYKSTAFPWSHPWWHERDYYGPIYGCQFVLWSSPEQDCSQVLPEAEATSNAEQSAAAATEAISSPPPQTTSSQTFD